MSRCLSVTAVLLLIQLSPAFAAGPAPSPYPGWAYGYPPKPPTYPLTLAAVCRPQAQTTVIPPAPLLVSPPDRHTATTLGTTPTQPNGRPDPYEFDWRPGTIQWTPQPLPPGFPPPALHPHDLGPKVVYQKPANPYPVMTHYRIALFPVGGSRNDPDAFDFDLPCQWITPWPVPYIPDMIRQFQGHGFDWQVAACSGPGDAQCAWSATRTLYWELPAPAVGINNTGRPIRGDLKLEAADVYGEDHYLYCVQSGNRRDCGNQINAGDPYVDDSSDETKTITRQALISNLGSGGRYRVSAAACVLDPRASRGVFCNWGPGVWVDIAD